MYFHKFKANKTESAMADYYSMNALSLEGRGTCPLQASRSLMVRLESLCMPDSLERYQCKSHEEH